MWGAGSKTSNLLAGSLNSDSENEKADYDFGAGGSSGAPRRAFFAPSMLMALNQQSNDVLASINFDRVIGNYMENQNIDCGVALSHHIIDCMYALKNVLNVQRNAASTPNELGEMELGASSALYNACLPELGGLVLSTVSNPWTSDQANVLSNYHAISEQIMHCFPEIFNKSSKATGNSLMHISCRYVAPVAAEPITKMLLSHTPKLISHPNNKNQYPLHMAMRNKGISLHVVKALMKGNEGAVSIADENGLLPLHYAVMAENSQSISYDIVEYLLKQDSNAAMKRCKFGRLPLHLAINTSSPSAQIINVLLRTHPEGCHTTCNNGWLPIHRLVSQPAVSLEVMKIFHQPQFKSCFDAVTTKGCQLPIHIYVDQENPLEIGVLSLLLASPQSVLETDKFSYTPLNIVLDNRHPAIEVAKLLLYGSNGATSTKIGVPYNTSGAVENPKVKEDTVFIYPLHFLVGMNEIANTELITIVAALYPEAINKAGSTQGFAWSPYIKAKERNFKDLIVIFDMILEVESYRQGIIQQFNENYSVYYEELVTKLKEAELPTKSVPSIPLIKGNSTVNSAHNQAIRLPKVNHPSGGSVGSINSGSVSALLPNLVNAKVTAGKMMGHDDSGSEANTRNYSRGGNKTGTLQDLDSDDLSLSSFTTIKTTKTMKVKTKPISPLDFAPANNNNNYNNNDSQSRINSNFNPSISEVINDALTTGQQKQTGANTLNQHSNRPSADVDLHKYLRPQQDVFDEQVTDIVIEKYNNKKSMTSQMRGGVKAIQVANNFQDSIDSSMSIGGSNDSLPGGVGARRRHQSTSKHTAPSLSSTSSMGSFGASAMQSLGGGVGTGGMMMGMQLPTLKDSSGSNIRLANFDEMV